MNTFLNNLQSKSEREKVLLATVVAILTTVLLFATWSYNFAHSGKINNLANSASGVAGVVEEAKIGESFNSALSQLKSLSDAFGTSNDKKESLNDDANKESEEDQNSVGAKHLNVFTNPETQQKFGENAGDVLY